MSTRCDGSPFVRSGGCGTSERLPCFRYTHYNEDRDGLAIWMKRLEAGTFETPKSAADQSCLELDPTQLAMLLSGVSLESVKRRKRFALAG